MFIALATSQPKDKNTIETLIRGISERQHDRTQPHSPHTTDKPTHTLLAIARRRAHSDAKTTPPKFIAPANDIQNISPDALDRHYTIQFHSTKLNKFSTNQRRSTGPVNGPAARTHATNDARTQGTRKQTSSSRHDPTEC
jgi:hypothetical protein